MILVSKFKKVKKQHFVAGTKIFIYIYIFAQKRTGSGKSSVLNALYNLYKKESGHIFIKGIDQNNLTLNQLRKQMVIIFLIQNKFILSLIP